MSTSNNLDLYAKEAWINTLKTQLFASYGNKKGIELFNQYQSIFDYLMISSVELALIDIKGLESCQQHGLATQFEAPNDNDKSLISLNLYAQNHAVELSDSLAILQSMGLRVLLEKPKKLTFNGKIYWIHRYQAKHNNLDVTIDETLSQNFDQLYLLCWQNNYSIDSFNQLLFSAQLSAQEIQLLRAYAAYSKQLKTTYSADYIAEALIHNTAMCRLLIREFIAKFNPTEGSTSYVSNNDEFLEQLNDVVSLDHDSILKKFFELITATCRTNYFQASSLEQQTISFKLTPSLISQIPKPIPEFEIFIYSKRFEGTHLRGGKVARGGLRWSNRPEDYRTEVLGLMKAQMIKNAVIVPTGSKGGFVCKLLTIDQTREFQLNEVEQCYRLYITNLLQLTDNVIDGNITHPKSCKIYDGDDPYLVVAADKGTATFSDIANSIAHHQYFWLDDAFASGGSVGYDHKKMGITARGAWESVKRHFLEIDIDCQQQEFSVLGIGDMSGDVFGNGMLLSPKIKLVAAFNHLHIFIDPSPSSATSFKERQRLFQLPRSSWDNYNKQLISAGGGVFNRRSKKIAVSNEMKQLLNINTDTVTPNQLITYILTAKADLLWNGGIGTYIKAETETHADVQDKANDAIRIDGRELNVKMVGEGGNLGVTQLGRIEFATLGGNIYSDAIDNSAGVDCSDHEVNIKILLQQVMQDGLLNCEQRNKYLESMTDDVAQLTLSNNKKQTQIIDMMALDAHKNCHEHARFITHLDESKVLSRKLEQLPTNEQLKERITLQRGLTKPELAVLLSYSKLVFKQALLSADCFDNHYFEKILIDYFPSALQQQFGQHVVNHALKNNIIATLLSNQIVNQLGIGFGFKMKEEISANIVQIVKAYLCVIEIFNLNTLWQDIENMSSLPVHIRYRCLQTIAGLIQRSISWILRTYPRQFEMNTIIQRFKTPAKELQSNIVALLSGDTKREYNSLKKLMKKHTLDEQIIEQLPAVIPLSSTFDIAEISINLNCPMDKAAKLFYAVAQKLDLQWIKQKISLLNKNNHWHQLAIASMRNELHRHQKKISFYLLKGIKNKHHIKHALEQWEKNNSFAIKRYLEKLATVKNSRQLDYAMLIVTVNEVRILAQQLAADEHY